MDREDTSDHTNRNTTMATYQLTSGRRLLVAEVELTGPVGREQHWRMWRWRARDVEAEERRKGIVFLCPSPTPPLQPSRASPTHIILPYSKQTPNNRRHSSLDRCTFRRHSRGSFNLNPISKRRCDCVI